MPDDETPYTDWLREQGFDLPAGSSVFDDPQASFSLNTEIGRASMRQQLAPFLRGVGVPEAVPTGEELERFQQLKQEARRGPRRAAVTLDEITRQALERRIPVDELLNELISRYGAVATPDEKPKRSRAWWRKALDAGKNVFGTTLDALAMPANWTERTLGGTSFALLDKLGLFDMPDGISYWDMGALTWDMLLDAHSFYSLNKMRADVDRGVSWDEVMRRYGSASGNLIGQAVADPLWLIGGLGLAAKTPDAARTSSLASRLIKYGLIGGEGAPVNLYKTRAYDMLGDVPVMGAPIRVAARVIGRPPAELVREEALEAQVHVAREILERKEAGGRAGGWIRNLFRYSPSTLAEETHGLTLKWLSIPFFISEVTPRELISTIDGLIANNVDAIPSRFGQTIREPDVVKVTSETLQAAGYRKAADIKAVKRFEKAVVADTSLAGNPAEMQRLGYEVLNEVQGKVQRAASAMFNVNPNAPTNRLYSAMKLLLTATLLDRPGFTFLNMMNNFGTVVWDDPFTGIFKGGFGLLPRYAERRAAQFGTGKEMLTMDTVDASTLSALTGLAVSTTKKAGMAQTLKNAALPFVWMAGRVDLGARMTRALDGFRDFIRWGSHTLRKLPDDVANALPSQLREALEAAPESAAMMGDDTLEHLYKAVSEGSTWSSAKPILTKWLKAQGWPDDAIKAVSQDFGTLVEALDVGLREAASPEEFMRLLEQTAGDITSKTHHVRDASKLDTVGRLRTGFTMGEAANLHHMLGQRDRILGDDLRRFLRAISEPLGTDVVELVFRQRDSLAERYAALWRRLGEGDMTALDALDKLALDASEEWAKVGEEVSGKLITQEGRRAWQHVSRQVLEVDNDIARRLRFLGDEMRLAGRWDDFGSAWDSLFDSLTEVLNTELRLRKSMLGSRPRSRFRFVRSIFDQPDVNDAQSLQGMEMLRFLFESKDELLDLARNPVASGDLSKLTPSQRESLMAWLEETRAAVSDLRVGGRIAGRAMADWTMLNYSRLYGFDDIVKWAYPYFVWPSRSMQRWAQRFAAAPGRAAVLAQLRETQQDINDQLPERLKNLWRLPIPGVAEELVSKFTGAPPGYSGGGVFFDITKMLASPLQFAMDFPEADRTNTVAGAVLDYASNLGPSVNPYIPRVLALVGGGMLDRQAWLQGQWFPSLPFGLPSSGAIMGIRALLGSDVSNEQFQNILLGKENTPDYILKKILKIPDDEWDIYRIRRAGADISAMEAKDTLKRLRKAGASEEEIRAELQNLIASWSEAMLNASGPKYAQAKKFASGEAGLRALSSWALGMPVSIYPEGERLQRGLDAIYRQAAAAGRAADFFDAYPEYTMYHAAVAGIDSPDDARKELASTAYWSAQGKAHAYWDGIVDKLTVLLRDLQSNEELLTTADGRFRVNAVAAELSAAKERRADELDEIKATFPDADLRPSLRRVPRDRALNILETIYYGILEKDYDAEFAKVKDPTQRSELAELRRKADLERMKDSLRDEGPSPLFWLEMTAAASALRQSYDLKVGEAFRNNKPELADELMQERDLALEKLTDDAARNVSKAEFESHLARNRQPDPPAYALYKQAQREMGDYRAIEDAPGLTDKQKSRARKLYWDSHPLLKRFYGNEEGLARANPVVAARLDRIRDGFYDLDDGDARIDYLYLHLDEYNELAAQLEIPPVNLSGYLPPDDERDDLSLPGTMPQSHLLDRLLSGRYAELLK